MFARHEVLIPVSLSIAAAQLDSLVRDGFFGGMSRRAYADGLTGLMRVGPIGSALGTSKLVRVHLLAPFHRGDSVVLALRWEATGVTGRLFPVLDGDLVLTPLTEQTTRFTLTGAYRPPLGNLGAGLDRLVLNRAATATVRSLVSRIADELADPHPAQPSPDVAAGRWRIAPPDAARPRANGRDVKRQPRAANGRAR
jgi:hypothetical protein